MTCVQVKADLKEEMFPKVMASMEAIGLFLNQSGAIYGTLRREFPINLENNLNLVWDCGDMNYSLIFLSIYYSLIFLSIYYSLIAFELKDYYIFNQATNEITYIYKLNKLLKMLFFLLR